VKFDRTFKSGESFTWEGNRFTVDWMPGQTEFGCCVRGKIDGKLVAFTGDNIFANAADPAQDGHEAVVAHNSAIFEEGYIYGAEYLQKLQPDLIVGGHSFVMDRPKQLIERYHDWAVRIRDAYRGLSAEQNYEYMFDPYWVRADPYRVTCKSGGEAEVTLYIRNFKPQAQKHRIELHTPEGIVVEPSVVDGQVNAKAIVTVPVRMMVQSGSKDGIRLVAMDITLDGKRYGELFDFVVNVMR